MQQLQRTIITQAQFIHIFVLNYISLQSKILGISFYTAAWGMKNLKTSTFCFEAQKHVQKKKS